jgi:hypothetical protein
VSQKSTAHEDDDKKGRRCRVHIILLQSLTGLCRASASRGRQPDPGDATTAKQPKAATAGGGQRPLSAIWTFSETIERRVGLSSQIFRRTPNPRKEFASKAACLRIKSCSARCRLSAFDGTDRTARSRSERMYTTRRAELALCKWKCRSISEPARLD